MDLQRDLATFLGIEKGFFILPLGSCPPTAHPAGGLEPEMPQWRDPELQNTASSLVHKTNWIWNSCFSLHKLHIRKSPNTPPGQVITATDWSRAFQSSQKRGESFSFLFRVLEIIQSRAVDPPFFADSVPAVLLNADPDPAAFLMRIRIQLKVCKTNNLTKSFLELNKIAQKLGQI